MHELVALSTAHDAQPIAFDVVKDGRRYQDAVRLTGGAVHVFFAHTRTNVPEVVDGVIGRLLVRYIAAWVQHLDFSSVKVFEICGEDMSRHLGNPVVVRWDRNMTGPNTPYGSQGTPLAALEYTATIEVSGDCRTVPIRVGYAAYLDLKEKTSDAWDRLKNGVTTAFEARLAQPRYVPKGNDVVELGVDEVLSHC